MMSDINRGTVPVPLTGEGVAEVKVATDAASVQLLNNNEPATKPTDACAETTLSGFVSAPTMPESDEPSSNQSNLKEVATAAVPSHNQEGEDLQQPQSSGGIAFLTSLSAEALQEFDMPEYVKRHNATLTFPEKVRSDFSSID
jgi:hypothetical protein